VNTPTITVEAAFGLANPGDFIVGTSLVGGADLVASGYNEVTTAGRQAEITRGRWSQITDVIDAGDMSVNLLNLERDFDPKHTTSPYYGKVRPGVRVRLRAQADGFDARTLMTGWVDGWRFEYEVDGYNVAIAECTDALGMLGAAEFNDWTSTGTSAHAKLTAVCERPEVAWPTSLTDFNVGVEALQSDAVSWGSNVLNYMQLIARSELGYLFAAADGTLTFRDRNVAASESVSVSFGGSGIGYQEIAAKYGEFLFSRVGVDREGGTNQTAEVADVSAWVALNGPARTLSLTGLLLGSDAQSLALAEFLLTQYSQPIYQIAEIGVELNGMAAADQDAVLGLEITDLVSVEFTPNNLGTAISQTLLVQGIAHEMQPGSHVVRLSLIGAPLDLFIVGSSLVGGTDVVGF